LGATTTHTKRSVWSGVLCGIGLAALIVGFARRAAAKNVDAFARGMKAAVEAG
jgi:hypothetical protein